MVGVLSVLIHCCLCDEVSAYGMDFKKKEFSLLSFLFQNIFKHGKYLLYMLKLGLFLLISFVSLVSLSTLSYKVSAVCIDTPVCENSGVGSSQLNNCISSTFCANQGDGSSQSNNCNSNF